MAVSIDWLIDSILRLRTFRFHLFTGGNRASCPMPTSTRDKPTVVLRLEVVPDKKGSATYGFALGVATTGGLLLDKQPIRTIFQVC